MRELRSDLIPSLLVAHGTMERTISQIDPLLDYFFSGLQIAGEAETPIGGSAGR